jgi:polyhydroxyalkanoate synthesis regulator phasin
MEENAHAPANGGTGTDSATPAVPGAGPGSALGDLAAASKERARLADFFKEAWSQALLKVEAAEDEAARVLHRAGDLAGWRPDDVKRLAKEFTERLSAQRREFETSLDEGIHRAVSRLKLPRRDDLEALVRRLDQVEARIEALHQKRN